MPPGRHHGSGRVAHGVGVGPSRRATVARGDPQAIIRAHVAAEVDDALPVGAGQIAGVDPGRQRVAVGRAELVVRRLLHRRIVAAAIEMQVGRIVEGQLRWGARGRLGGRRGAVRRNGEVPRRIVHGGPRDLVHLPVGEQPVIHDQVVERRPAAGEGLAGGRADEDLAVVVGEGAARLVEGAPDLQPVTGRGERAARLDEVPSHHNLGTASAADERPDVHREVTGGGDHLVVLVDCAGACIHAPGVNRDVVDEGARPGSHAAENHVVAGCRDRATGPVRRRGVEVRGASRLPRAGGGFGATGVQGGGEEDDDEGDPDASPLGQVSAPSGSPPPKHARRQEQEADQGARADRRQRRSRARGIPGHAAALARMDVRQHRNPGGDRHGDLGARRFHCRRWPHARLRLRRAAERPQVDAPPVGQRLGGEIISRITLVGRRLPGGEVKVSLGEVREFNRRRQIVRAARQPEVVGGAVAVDVVPAAPERAAMIRPQPGLVPDHQAVLDDQSSERPGADPVRHHRCVTQGRAAGRAHVEAGVGVVAQDDVLDPRPL